MRARIFFGRVTHARLRPKRNAFRYGVFFLKLPLSCIGRLPMVLFSVNRWNLFSFHFRDHGARDGSPPEPWIRSVLAREGVTEADGEIVLQTFPRMLGYVFNPVSFWFCHDRGGAVRAILCEVNNTFGEHHNYLLLAPDRGPIGSQQELTARKVFYVSPFCDVDGDYRFRFSGNERNCEIRIDYRDAYGWLLLTSISGTAAPFTVVTLLRAFLFYPWMGFGVIARIHWQAAKLWFKGVRHVSRPIPPQQETTR